MEIVQSDVHDEDASEVLRQVQSAVQTMQRPSVVDTNEQVHAQLETGDVAILPGPGDAAPGTVCFQGVEKGRGPHEKSVKILEEERSYFFMKDIHDNLFLLPGILAFDPI